MRRSSSPLVLALVLAVSCGDNEHPPLPPCPPNAVGACTVRGICVIDGKRCAINFVDAGEP